ncbi:MAG: hypothetical protein E6767_16285 [Dysgonomonas sp.]|nr:hypothetical protein [Dysgonomonas sp.]
MKKINLLWLVAIILLSIGFASCSDDDDNKFTIYKNVGTEIDGAIYEKVKSYEAKIGGFSLFAKGGTGSYSASVEDPSIANFLNTHEGHGKEYIVLEFSALKVGSTKITITDGEKSIVIPLTISSKSRPMYVEAVRADVDVDGEDLQEEIEEDVLKTQPVKAKGSFGMEFETFEKGKVTVVPENNSTEKYEGTFEIENASGAIQYYHLTYNGATYKYMVEQSIKSEKALGPISLKWTLDLTDTYKQKYPNATIRKVEYEMEILARWY